MTSTSAIRRVKMNKQCICVRMIGRPIDNPVCRIAGLPTVQRLEPCVWGGVNTLTSVAKDNMILEIMEDDDNEQTV